MRISAKADYATRAALVLAAAAPEAVKAERIAAEQEIPRNFCENILGDLRRAGLVTSQRGSEGGHRLARSPETITVADVIRAVEGPLADVHGEPPEARTYPGQAAALQQVWIALRSHIRAVLEQVTLAELASGELAAVVTDACADPDAWQRRVRA